jgi:hypothetical protein
MERQTFSPTDGRPPAVRTVMICAARAARLRSPCTGFPGPHALSVGKRRGAQLQLGIDARGPRPVHQSEQLAADLAGFARIVSLDGA